MELQGSLDSDCPEMPAMQPYDAPEDEHHQLSCTEDVVFCEKAQTSLDVSWEEPQDEVLLTQMAAPCIAMRLAELQAIMFQCTALPQQIVCDVTAKWRNARRQVCHQVVEATHRKVRVLLIDMQLQHDFSCGKSSVCMWLSMVLTRSNSMPAASVVWHWL
eukprot:2348959-Amphidinium_carterae.1